MEKKRILVLDFIRVSAMLLIIVYHWNASCVTEQVSTGTLFFCDFASGNIAHIGVSLFFILSGAALMCSFREERGPGDYLKRRFLSVYPAYWVCYAAVFLHVYVVHSVPMTIPKTALIWSVLGLDGFLSYRIPCYYLVGEWFVGCLVFLYLLFPLLYRCVSRHPFWTAAAAVLLYIPYVRFYPLEMDISHFPLTRLPEVMLGMYFILFRRRWEQEGKDPRVWRAAAGLLGLGTLAVLFKKQAGLPAPCLNILLGLSGFLFLNWIFARVSEGGLPARAAGLLSKYSYVIFLMHHYLMGRFLGPYAGKELEEWRNYAEFFLYLPCLLIISVILYYAAMLLRKFPAFICRAAHTDPAGRR